LFRSIGLDVQDGGGTMAPWQRVESLFHVLEFDNTDRLKHLLKRSGRAVTAVFDTERSAKSRLPAERSVASERLDGMSFVLLCMLCIL